MRQFGTVLACMLCVGIVCALTTSAGAALITVPNGDFATSLTGYTTSAGDVGGGWVFTRSASTVASGINDINMATGYTSGGLGSAYDEGGANGAGKLFIRFTNATTSNRWGYITSPNLGSGGAALAVAASTTYTLTVAVGNRGDTPWPNGTNEIQLLTAGTSRASTTTPEPANYTFVDYTTSFKTDATGTIVEVNGAPVVGNPNVLGETLLIRLYGRKQNTAGSAHDIEWDSVRLDVTTIPEPATMALLGLGGLGALLRRRRR